MFSKNKSCHPFGIWIPNAIFFYNPIIPSGLQTTLDTRYFLLFTSHAPRLLRLPNVHAASLSNFYFGHARPQRLADGNAFSTIG